MNEAEKQEGQQREKPASALQNEEQQDQQKNGNAADVPQNKELAKELETIQILGIPVNRVSMRQAVSRYRQLMEWKQEDGCHGPCRLIVTPNSEIVLNAKKDPSILKVILSADLVIPDGIGLVYASKILGEPLTERVTGIDFLEHILIDLTDRGESVFFLGSKPGQNGEPGVAQLAAANMQKKYPSLKVAGTHHGYYKPEEEEALVEEINRSGAEFLCVATGSPKQEQFIYNHRNQLKPRVGIGVGGSLDVWAGTLKRAPEFYQKHGLEWLYRLIQEPSRYKRMAKLPVFMLKVLVSPRNSK